MDPVKIPTEIDTPHQILLWATDEFVPFIMFMTIGNLIGHLISFCIIGAIVGHLYKRYKNTRSNGYLHHLLYWLGFGFAKGRTFVNPFKREFLP